MRSFSASVSSPSATKSSGFLGNAAHIGSVILPRIITRTELFYRFGHYSVVLDHIRDRMGACPVIKPTLPQFQAIGVIGEVVRLTWIPDIDEGLPGNQLPLTVRLGALPTALEPSQPRHTTRQIVHDEEAFVF